MTKEKEKELLDLPDNIWNAVIANNLYAAVNLIRDKYPFLGLVGAKGVLDDMNKLLGR